MEYTYAEVIDEDGKLIGVNRSDGWWIPANEANSDYVAYLESLKPKADEAKTK